MVYSSVYLIMYLYYFITVLNRWTTFAEYIIISLFKWMSSLYVRRCFLFCWWNSRRDRRGRPSPPPPLWFFCAIAGVKLLYLFAASRTYINSTGCWNYVAGIKHKPYNPRKRRIEPTACQISKTSQSSPLKKSTPLNRILYMSYRVCHDSEQVSCVVLYADSILVTTPTRTWTVSRRYNDFVALDAELKSSTGQEPPSPLPPKTWGLSLGKNNKDKVSFLWIICIKHALKIIVGKGAQTSIRTVPSLYFKYQISFMAICLHLFRLPLHSFSYQFSELIYSKANNQIYIPVMAVRTRRPANCSSLCPVCSSQTRRLGLYVQCHRLTFCWSGSETSFEGSGQ